jgi:hypothetical protein
MVAGALRNVLRFGTVWDDKTRRVPPDQWTHGQSAAFSRIRREDFVANNELRISGGELFRGQDEHEGYESSLGFFAV